MAGINWTKNWKPKTWKVTGNRLKVLKDAYEKKAKGIIEGHIKKLASNKRKGIGSARAQADITNFTYHLKPVSGEKGEYFSDTRIVPGAKEIPKTGKRGGTGSLVSPTPPPHP